MLGGMALPLFTTGAQNPRKEVGAMTCQLILNWKSFAALGAAAVAWVLAKRVPPEQAANVLNNLFSAAEVVITGNRDD